LQEPSTQDIHLTEKEWLLLEKADIRAALALPGITITTEKLVFERGNRGRQ